jgi:hypothetical protein
LRLSFCGPILAVVLGATAFPQSDANSSLAQTAAPISSNSADSPNGSKVETASRSELKNEFLKSAYAATHSPSKPSPTPAPLVEFPREELFVGYSHVRFGVSGSSGQTSFSFDGGSIAFTYNLKRWLGLAGEFSLYNISSVPSAASTTYLFGPRFSHRTGRFSLYAQSLRQYGACEFICWRIRRWI